MDKDLTIKKNENYILDIYDIGSEGEGIGNIDGFTVFVEGTVLGDKVEIKIINLKNSYAYGKLINIIQPSPNRVEAKCSNSSKCGGCQLQNYNYELQLKWKQKKVRDNLERIGKLENINILPIIGMYNPWNYRNKAQFPVGLKNKQLQIGFYSKRTHNIIDIDTCHIQHTINTTILEIIRNFIKEYNISPYDEKNHKGLIRHILTKVGFNTGEIMVCIIINGKKLPYSSELIEKLKAIKGITSIMLNYNTNKNNVILGEKLETLWGNSYITDYIRNIKFEISPKSFFQVNPVQTKLMYEKVLEYADLTGEEIIWDAYCGIGTISLVLSQNAKRVYGVEILEDAIKDAKRNAEINSITNTDFYIGKAEEIIPKMYQEKGIKADIIVVDPPRKGCDEKLLETMIEMKSKKIIYVSCDSATLARDLKTLSKEYKIKFVQPFDNFAMTTHLETVVLLCRN